MNKRKILSFLTSLVMTASLSLPVFAAELNSEELGAYVINGMVNGQPGSSVDFTIKLYENGDLKGDTYVTVPTKFILDDTGLHVKDTADAKVTCKFVAGNSNSQDIGAQVEISSNARASATPYSISLNYSITNPDDNRLKNNDEDYLKVLVSGVSDTTAPVVSATPDRLANEYVWYNKDVTVSFSATDPESAIKSVSSPITVSTEGKNQKIVGSATNSAGLTGTGSVEISIDKTAPTITGSADRDANAAGWYNSDVTVSFTANDALSGVAKSTSPTILGEGSNQSVTGTTVDMADNSATATVSGINIDETAPIISGSTDKTANAAGWYNSDVTVSFDAKDALSGIARNTTPVTLVEGANQSVTGTAVDRADNSTSATVSGINIDKTAPTINVEDGGTYILNQNETWSASDALSGLATPASGTIDTSKVGPHTQTISAADNAGNAVEKTISYNVQYAFGGILQPINIDGTSSFKLGSTVPVKFQLKDAAGNYVSNAAASITYAKLTGNVTGPAINAVSTSAAVAGNLFRYDSTSNQYIFNLSTKSTSTAPWSTGTYMLTITLDDGKTYTVRISIK